MTVKGKTDTNEKPFERQKRTDDERLSIGLVDHSNAMNNYLNGLVGHWNGLSNGLVNRSNGLINRSNGLPNRSNG